MGDGPFSDMSDVDTSGTAARYTGLIARVSSQMRAEKERFHDLLKVGPGSRVLDLGCGAGDDVAELAARVAPDGRVIGVDRSRDLLAEAGRRHADKPLPLEFREGDARRLELPDETFDACRAERVLQHLDDPAAAVVELRRVTRPGGRILIVDADYGTIAIDATDREVTREVLRERAEAAPQGWIGRCLPRLCREAGLEPTLVEGVTFPCLDGTLAFEIFELDRAAERCVELGRLAGDRVERWKAELTERDRCGTFFLASTGFLVLARKPVD